LPNLHVLATCCVRLELRSLPSTSVTRLQRYYEPLRHPRAPGLSVTGVRLVVPDHALGLPVLPALSLCTCCRHYPGAATGLVASLIHPVVSAFPGMAAGSACASTFSRLARRSLALRPAHSRCHQVVARFTRRLQPLRYLHDCSGCFRLERWPGGICTHWKSAALSRRTPTPAIYRGRCWRSVGGAIELEHRFNARGPRCRHSGLRDPARRHRRWPAIPIAPPRRFTCPWNREPAPCLEPAASIPVG
jgi:hypothetical protein